jgi:hypothetical protein
MLATRIRMADIAITSPPSHAAPAIPLKHKKGNDVESYVT